MESRGDQRRKNSHREGQQRWVKKIMIVFHLHSAPPSFHHTDAAAAAAAPPCETGNMDLRLEAALVSVHQGEERERDGGW